MVLQVSNMKKENVSLPTLLLVTSLALAACEGQQPVPAVTDAIKETGMK